MLFGLLDKHTNHIPTLGGYGESVLGGGGDGDALGHDVNQLLAEEDIAQAVFCL